MTFPSVPRDTITELYLSNTWVDVSTDVRGVGRIAIKRGGSSESATPSAASCRLTLENTTGYYSIGNPLSPYYGTLNRDTPIRTGIFTGRDTFTRTVASGWGSSDSGQAWTTKSVSGGFASAVGAGVGTHTVPTANSFQYTYLAGVSARDVEVLVTTSLSFTDVTGAQVEPANIMLRVQASAATYYMIRVAISTAEAITVGIFHNVNGQLAAGVSTGLTHSAGQSLKVRASIEGSTIRAKVWVATGNEPLNYQVYAYDTAISTAGGVGIRSGVALGNTNVPVTFSYDNLQLIRRRFCGYLSSMAPRWDSTQRDMTVGVDAYGPMRRLGQGPPPIGSTMRRALQNHPYVVAYWPCEDGKDATAISSGLSGGQLMTVGTDTRFATNTDFDCSDPLPTVGATGWSSPVPAHTIVDREQVRFLLEVPAAGMGGTVDMVSISTNGTISRIIMQVDNTGGMQLYVIGSTGASVLTTGFYVFNLNGSPRWCSIEFAQAGANVELNFVAVQPGAGSGTQTGIITILGQTVGGAAIVQVGGNGQNVVGHISIHKQWTSLLSADAIGAASAYNGEVAATRLSRLCTELSISFTLFGLASDSSAMGPQKSATVLDLLKSCAAVDMGILSEPRSDHGILYRTRVSLYTQTALLTLNNALGQVSPDLTPVVDDQNTNNDVIITMVDGPQARALLSSGAMSTLPPGSGGVGDYQYSATVNVYSQSQLLDLANWILRLGTVDDQRYSEISVNLARGRIVTAGLESSIFELDAGDRIAITNPNALHDPDTIDQIIVGYSERYANFEHTASFIGRPAVPFDIAALDGDFRLDSATTTLTSSITSTATSFQVSIGDGVLWTTAPAEWPIPVTIDGETMSVASISGASSPQTFSSVTRSLNGVVKAHSAGAQVNVTQPIYLGM